MTRSSTGLNLNAAIIYAKKHATNPNTNNYDYWNRQDCTNFVSQIPKAGDIQQQESVLNHEAKPRRHKKEGTRWGGNSHKESISFVNANTFARYMGVGYVTENHQEFSNNIEKGDIIGTDFDNDGVRNHMAFVVQKKQ